jgi:hypothetical protein
MNALMRRRFLEKGYENSGSIKSAILHNSDHGFKVISLFRLK